MPTRHNEQRVNDSLASAEARANARRLQHFAVAEMQAERLKFDDDALGNVDPLTSIDPDTLADITSPDLFDNVDDVDEWTADSGGWHNPDGTPIEPGTTREVVRHFDGVIY